MKRTRPTLLLLYVLLSYVIVQFVWWAILLYELNVEVAHLSVPQSGPEMEKLLHNKLFMIAGEGCVFLSLLLVGAFYIRKFLLREQKLARQERNFLLATTHELNSPIAAVKLNLQTLKRQGVSESQRAQMIESGIGTVQRLEGLVTNMLMASRLDAGGLVLVRETIDLSKIIAQVTSRYELMLAETKTSLVSTVERGFTFYADQQALEIIFSNLIHNSIKYAPGTAILIDAKKTAKEIEIIVSDQGPGVGADELKNIFRKFYRTENEETRSQKGTGLGLYLVRQLVELQKGSIKAEQNRPTGLCIKINLPQTE